MTNAIGFELWLDMIHKVPRWELAAGGLFFLLTFSAVAIYQFLKLYQLPLFHAFERIEIKRKDLDQAIGDAMQIEITIPKNSQVTAFQVQQKILKALHAVYQDPVEGPHAFSRHFYFFKNSGVSGRSTAQNKSFSHFKSGRSTLTFPSACLSQKSISIALRKPSLMLIQTRRLRSLIKTSFFKTYPNTTKAISPTANLLLKVPFITA